MKRFRRGITFGAFDPLHYGHIRIFQRAKEQCEWLVVGVSTPEYIEKHKGRVERFPYEARAEAVRSIAHVNEVVAQSPEFGKKQWVQLLKADVIFVGDDWTPQTFSGEGLGVPVIYLPHTEGVSSTDLTKHHG